MKKCHFLDFFINLSLIEENHLKVSMAKRPERQYPLYVISFLFINYLVFNITVSIAYSELVRIFHSLVYELIAVGLGHHQFDLVWLLHDLGHILYVALMKVSDFEQHLSKLSVGLKSYSIGSKQNELFIHKGHIDLWFQPSNHHFIPPFSYVIQFVVD